MRLAGALAVAALLASSAGARHTDFNRRHDAHVVARDTPLEDPYRARQFDPRHVSHTLAARQAGPSPIPGGPSGAGGSDGQPGVPGATSTGGGTGGGGGGGGTAADICAGTHPVVQPKLGDLSTFAASGGALAQNAAGAAIYKVASGGFGELSQDMVVTPCSTQTFSFPAYLSQGSGGSVRIIVIDASPSSRRAKRSKRAGAVLCDSGDLARQVEAQSSAVQYTTVQYSCYTPVVNAKVVVRLSAGTGTASIGGVAVRYAVPGTCTSSSCGTSFTPNAPETTSSTPSTDLIIPSVPTSCPLNSTLDPATSTCKTCAMLNKLNSGAANSCGASCPDTSMTADGVTCLCPGSRTLVNNVCTTCVSQLRADGASAGTCGSLCGTDTSPYLGVCTPCTSQFLSNVGTAGVCGNSCSGSALLVAGACVTCTSLNRLPGTPCGSCVDSAMSSDAITQVCSCPPGSTLLNGSCTCTDGGPLVNGACQTCAAALNRASGTPATGCGACLNPSMVAATSASACACPSGGALVGGVCVCTGFGTIVDGACKTCAAQLKADGPTTGTCGSACDANTSPYLGVCTACSAQSLSNVGLAGVCGNSCSGTALLVAGACVPCATLNRIPGTPCGSCVDSAMAADPLTKICSCPPGSSLVGGVCTCDGGSGVPVAGICSTSCGNTGVVSGSTCTLCTDPSINALNGTTGSQGCSSTICPPGSTSNGLACTCGLDETFVAATSSGCGRSRCKRGGGSGCLSCNEQNLKNSDSINICGDSCGTTAAANGLGCVACASNQVVIEGQNTCTTCVQGDYDAGRCSCPAGQTAVAGVCTCDDGSGTPIAGTCGSCSISGRVAGTAATGCGACIDPANMTAASPTSACTCPAGTTLVGSVCQCGTGATLTAGMCHCDAMSSYSDSTSTCTLCPVNSAAGDGRVCGTNCGTTSSASGSTCTLCPMNEMVPSGSTTCTPCASLGYANTPGTTPGLCGAQCSSGSGSAGTRCSTCASQVRSQNPSGTCGPCLTDAESPSGICYWNVVDPSFELAQAPPDPSSSSAPGGTPQSGWKYAGGFDDNSGIVAARSRTGSRSLGQHSTRYPGTLTCQTLEVVPGVTFTFSMWAAAVYTAGNGGTSRNSLQMYVWDGAGTTGTILLDTGNIFDSFSTQVASINSYTLNWQHASFSVAPSSSGVAYVCVVGYNPSGMNYIDDVSFQPADVPAQCTAGGRAGAYCATCASSMRLENPDGSCGACSTDSESAGGTCYNSIRDPGFELAVSPPDAKSNALPNGTPQGGWYLSGSTDFSGVITTRSHSGSRSLALREPDLLGTRTCQVLTQVKGVPFTLSVWLAAVYQAGQSGGGKNRMSLLVTDGTWTGDPILLSTLDIFADHSVQVAAGNSYTLNWAQRSWTVPAASSGSVLVCLDGYSKSGAAYFDDIEYVPTV